MSGGNIHETFYLKGVGERGTTGLQMNLDRHDPRGERYQTTRRRRRRRYRMCFLFIHHSLILIVGGSHSPTLLSTTRSGAFPCSSCVSSVPVPENNYPAVLSSQKALGFRMSDKFCVVSRESSYSKIPDGKASPASTRAVPQCCYTSPECTFTVW